VDQDSQTQPTPVPTTPVSPSTPQPAPAWTPDPTPTPMPATAPVAAAPVRRGPSTRVLNTVLAGALVLAVAGIAFAVGRMTAPAAAASARGNFPGGGQGPNGYFGGRQGGGTFGGGVFGAGGAGGGVTISGTVDAVSATTLTLKLASGQTIQIALDPTTTYHSQTNASASDIVTGGTVQVQLNLGRGAGGAGGEDGAVTGPTARDITVVP
jgi:hypothetical protein